MKLFYLILITFLVSCKQEPNFITKIEGWNTSNLALKSYVIFKDDKTYHNGRHSMCIESKNVKYLDVFSNSYQCIDATQYRGKRIKYTSWMKAENIKGWAGLWLRIDGDTMTYGFDNMKDGLKDRSLSGTKDWMKYEIVLDVNEAAESINLGALLTGKGKVWIDDSNLEVVDNTIPITGIELNESLYKNTHEEEYPYSFSTSSLIQNQYDKYHKTKPKPSSASKPKLNSQLLNPGFE